MNENYEAICKILNSPPRRYTKEEAIDNLKKCGIMNEQGQICDVFRMWFDNEKS